MFTSIPNTPKQNINRLNLINKNTLKSSLKLIPAESLSCKTMLTNFCV